MTEADCRVQTRFKVGSNELLIFCGQSSLRERVCSSGVDRMKAIDSTVNLPITVDLMVSCCRDKKNDLIDRCGFCGLFASEVWVRFASTG